MTILTFFVPAFAVVSGTQLNLTMDSIGRWTMPISARLRSSGAEINGSVFLDIDGLVDFDFDPDQSDVPVSVDIADSFILDDPSLHGRTFTLSGNFSIPNVSDPGLWNTMHASLDVGYQSAFARGLQQIIITPTGNGQSGLFLLDPSSPDQYAYEGQWFHVNCFRENFTDIEASVVVGNYPASAPAEFSFDMLDHITTVPLEAFQQIVGDLERAGFRTIDDPSDGRSTRFQVVANGGLLTIGIAGSSTAELAQILPPIHFEMVSGIQRFQITAYPEDYIREYANGHALTITTDSERGRNNIGTIGTNVLRRLALQVDYANRRIGFAEPVDEI